MKTRVAEQPVASVEKGEWVVCSPETVREFSAVAYIFARELHGHGGMAQGLVNASWGGTRIETWMSREALASKPAFDVINTRWKQTLEDYPARKAAYEKDLAAWTAEKKAAGGGGAFTKKMPFVPRGPGSPDTPSGAFNAVIAPLIPLSVRGVLWYQGEQNWERPQEYGALFQSLIVDWRQRWGRQELPFLFVQLPNYGSVTGTRWASLREGQASALWLPATHMAVTVDVRNPKELHPTNKQDVGHRLALLARRWVFNEDIIAEGPRFKSTKPEGSALRVLFDPPEGKLVLRDAPVDGVAFEAAGRTRS